MRLNKDQQDNIKKELKKYLLGGYLERDERTPILIGSKNGNLIQDNDEFLDELKIWIEEISNKKTDWVAGIDNGEPFLGLCLIKNATNKTDNTDFYRLKEFRFVIELKGVLNE